MISTDYNYFKLLLLLQVCCFVVVCLLVCCCFVFVSLRGDEGWGAIVYMHCLGSLAMLLSLCDNLSIPCCKQVGVLK